MWRRVRSLRPLQRPLLLGASALTGAGLTLAYASKQDISDTPLTRLLSRLSPLRGNALAESPDLRGPTEEELASPWVPPTRAHILQDLRADEEYDVLVIGGGATGSGVALDAATRGLKVALVERDDYAAGTSSRSTKLVHGGVRYLEKAFWELDYEQYKLVREAMHERSVFLHTAPHLSYALPIMLPMYSWWQIPYFWAGCKLYDMMAGKEQLQNSYLLGRKRALEEFPMLKADKLVGAMVYYDGQHNDSRMNLALAVTAAQHGATVANHVEVRELLKEGPESRIRGAKVRDTLTGEEWTIRAKTVVNATGPFSDGIRKMDEVTTEEMVVPSAGVHIILPNYYAPAHMGLLDPSTSDGRVIFFLPWEGGTIAGTTDSPTDVTANPMPREEEIQWILNEVKSYLNADVQVRREDVLAAWSGIRPLVKDPSAHSTQALVRSHIVNTSPAGLITIAGGKWTTYRAMASEAVDEVVKRGPFPEAPACSTAGARLIGAHHYSPTMFIRLIQRYDLESRVAAHLASSYGDRAYAVAELARAEGGPSPRLLAPAYPYLEAEVRWAVRAEWACTAVDVIGRRLRLGFLNARVADEALPRLCEIMGEELGWSKAERAAQQAEAHEWLKYMGL